MSKRATDKAFDNWWCDPKRPDVTRGSPYEVCMMAFAAGRASVPTSKKLRQALTNLLNMLDEWDAGFDGFGEVNAAERALKRPLSKIK